MSTSTQFTCKCGKQQGWITDGEETKVPCPTCGRWYKGVYNSKDLCIDAVEIKKKRRLRIRFKWVFRYDKYEKILRIFRVCFDVGEMDGKGYSAKISLALSRKVFKIQKEMDGIRLHILGIRIHFKKSYGGYFE
jgi:hypothetical protein